MFFMCGANEREPSRMTPRLFTWAANGMGKPSMMMCDAGVICELVRVDLEPMSRASVTVKLQEVPAHPAPDVLKAGGEGGWGEGSGGFGGNVDLCVIGVAVKINLMVTEDFAQGEEIYDE